MAAAIVRRALIPVLLKRIPILLLLLATTHTQAQTLSVLKGWLDGSKGQLAKDSFVLVQDTAYFNPTLQAKLDTPYQVKNIITFKLNEYARVLLPVTFTASVNVRIIYTRPDFILDSVDRTLSINYSDTSAYTSRSSFVFNNAHSVNVKVLGLTTSAPPRVLSALLLENEIDAQITYKLSCANDGVKSISIEGNIPANTDSTDELSVTWPVVTGADVYDLEWSYIDSTALLSGRYGNPFNRELIFRNNASRVTLAGFRYSIPLLYDDGGVLFFRVRAVQERPDGSRVETAWSSIYSGGMGQFSFTGHQRALNWQSSVSYAEDGKRKAQVNYFDGSLRSRQTVTKDNTTNTTIITESMYDYQGRPVIKVLPAPTLSTVIKYSRNFNRSVNGAEYDRGNYDTLINPADFLSESAKPMSTSSGANQYYSPDNPEKDNGINKYIPDAGGYAFTETSYTQDNTGRISREGGLGPVHRLGSNHETKYSYGTPGDNDLDALFGTEVGPKNHYFKNIVEDANGQYSVNYVDMYGRTIATALSGVPDSANLAGLSYNPIISYTDTLSRSNNRIVKDLVMENIQTQLVTIEDDYSFKYQLNAPVLQSKSCINGATICYNALYDLQITITDDASNQRLGGKPFDTVFHNYTPGTIPTGCGTPGFNISFTKHLVPGSYQISKRLVVNTDALDYYRDSVFVKNQVCVTLEQFIQQQRDSISRDTTACIPDCKTCRDSVGTWDAFRIKYMIKGGIAAADSSRYRGAAYAAYESAVNACDILCDAGSEIGAIRNAMLLDVTGPYGQYATLDSVNAYSVFYHRDETELPPYSRDSVIYYDESGKRDTVYDDRNDTYVIPQKLDPQQFIAKFKTSWAESLLKFHPEYYKLLEMEKFKDSYIWDKSFESVETYSEAKAKGYLNPTANNGFYFPAVLANKDPLAVSQKDALENKLNNANGGSGTSQLSMWSMAAVSMKCSGGSLTCYQQYNTPAKAFDSTLMCKGDLDMSWRSFRQMYLTTKHNIINDRVNNVVYPEYPKVTSAQLSAAGNQPHFYIASEALAENGGGFLNSTDTTVLKDSIAAKLQRSYDENCRSYVQAWVKQLAPCKYDSIVVSDYIIPTLLEICKEGCDIDHPYGASSVRPSSTYEYRSFQQFLEDANSWLGVTDPFECNEYIVTIPAPYDKQPVLTNRPTYTLPADCECGQLKNLQAEYQALKRPSDITLATYLNRTRGTSLSEVQVQQLLSACNLPTGGTCSYFEEPLIIPAIMQCNVAPACATCDMVNKSLDDFKRLYPGVTPQRVDTDSSQLAKNQLFVNYMNNQLGMTKQMWQYLDFLDTCKLYPYKDTTVCRGGQQLIHTYSSGNLDSIYDVIRTPDNGFLLAGSTMIANNNNNAYLIRTNSKGDVLWAKHYGSFGTDNFLKVRNTTDGGFIAMGTIAMAPGAFQRGGMIVKLADNGNVTWSRRVGLNTTWGETGADIIQASDGSYAYVVKYNLADNVADFMVGSMSANGTSNWIRRFGKSSGDEGYAIVQNADTLVVSGCSYISGLTGFNGWLLKVNRNSGILIRAYGYDIGEPEGKVTNFSSFLYKTNNGYMVNYSAGSNNVLRQSILNVNNNGEVISARLLSRPYNRGVGQWMPMVSDADGNVMAVQNTVVPEGYMPVWEKIKADNTVQWSLPLKLDSSTYMNKVIENADGGYVTAGAYGRSAMMFFMPASGSVACRDADIHDTFDATKVVVDLNLSITANNVISDTAVQAFNLIATNMSPVHRALNCSSGDSCIRVSRGPLLCGNANPVFESTDPNTIDNCSDNEFFAVSKGTELFNAYRDSIMNSFDKAFIDSSMNGGLREIFTVSYKTSEYHYTLYYYDRAGNLIKTVPPAGVVVNRTAAWLNSVKAARRAGTERLPAHTMLTNYRYNTLGNVTEMLMPDITQPHKYAYDRIGRQVSARAINPSNTLLTAYDNIGRISWTGTTPSALLNAVSRNPYTLAAYYEAANPTTIIKNTYDEPLQPLVGVILSPRNLRNRVAWSALYSSLNTLNAGAYSAATFYSYDIHGNVDTLVQDFKIGGMADAGNRWKKMVYTYDLISGKTNSIAYQPGQIDAYYHRYFYDAENRLINVETSRDNINWDNDAYYQYYRHGSLARSVIGEQQVQGIDYAYTLQGWLKGINSTSDMPVFDMGSDGSSTSIVARDAFGVALHYYGPRDYKSVSGITPFADADVAGNNFKPLFNGNVAAISQNLPAIGTPLLYTYSYDVLNRLAGAQTAKGFDKTNNVWTPVELPDFKEDVTYDPNGNITTFNRSGNNSFAGKPIQMDSLVYNYIANTNKLSYISDVVPSSNYDNDIDNQSPGNYTYNTIGQLSSDAASNLSTINFTAYGKLRQINSTTSGATLYTYDAINNRIVKSSGGIETWYVRDATGNIISIYTKGDNSINGGQLTQREVGLYGLTRLGIHTFNTKVQNVSSPELVKLNGLGTGINVNFVRGSKLLELSNHLGNVLSTISDRKVAVSSDGSNVDYYRSDVVSAQEYYAFGMQAPGRGFNSNEYRYGFNGKENDNEVKGEGNQQDYGMRIYDPRIGKFLSVDPLTAEYPELTPYQFASNSPISGVDLDGLEYYYAADGKFLGHRTTDSKGNALPLEVSNGVRVAESVMTQGGLTFYLGVRDLHTDIALFTRIAGLAYSESGYSDNVIKGIPFAIMNHHKQLKNSGASRYGEDWHLSNTLFKMRNRWTDDQYANETHYGADGNPAFRNFLGINLGEDPDLLKNVSVRNGNAQMKLAFEYTIKAFQYQAHNGKDLDFSYGGIGWQGVDIFNSADWKKWLYVDQEIKSFGFSNWSNSYNLDASLFQATKVFQGGSKGKSGKHFGSTLFYKSTKHSFSTSKTGQL
ncbi:RHS repeat-associated core domain-containing protein [Chitinophaga sp. YR627]|nr:RHS repeat-associated core domain-containing protein [Chitinophaga sp. YR627]